MVAACSTADADDDGNLSREEIDDISRAVVRIVTLAGGEPIASGSGTIVDPEGRIYTNRHVIEGGDDFEIEILDDVNEQPVPRYRARIVGYSLDVDFALLEIDRDVDGAPVNARDLDLPALSVDELEVQRGDPIFVFGYPGIGEGFLAFTEGSVTTIRNGTMDDRRMPVWYQTDAQISPGNSGGLAVNAGGKVVGIPTAVLSEGVTGGRLGGILAVNAVLAALHTGLETDLARVMEGTTSPVIEGGSLDFTEDPYFGSVALSTGFSPDPYIVEMVSGGEVDASYLGGGCTGYAAIAPDYRLRWSGAPSSLRVFFAADDGGDTTLLINRPDGSWSCNDDSGAGSLDPMLVFDDALQGQYDIWVASYSAGDFVEGTLYVSAQSNLLPTSVGPGQLDHNQPAYFGAPSLRAGFTPDPYTIDIVGGGSVDASYLGGACTGFAAPAPDFRLSWSGTSDELRILFEAEDRGDAVLIARLPDGSWRCGDDYRTGAPNPMLVLPMPAVGQYDVWVASYDRTEFVQGTLLVTELRLEPR